MLWSILTFGGQNRQPFGADQWATERLSLVCLPPEPAACRLHGILKDHVPLDSELTWGATCVNGLRIGEEKFVLVEMEDWKVEVLLSFHGLGDVSTSMLSKPVAKPRNAFNFSFLYSCNCSFLQCINVPPH